MEPITLLYIAFLLLVAGAIIAAAISSFKRACGWISLAFVSASSICLLYLAIYVFIKGATGSVEILTLYPLVNASLSVGIDTLSALLLFIISIISFCTTLFSIRYVRRYERESMLRYYPLLLLLFASIVGVVAMRDMLFFIAFWELMTLTSWALVVYERESKISLRAGLEYFIATHIATGLIVLAAVILYSRTPGPSFSFEALRASLGTLLTSNPALVHLILALFFIGFVTKAGVLPFGFWLPDAYPAAPSSASAAFAGTMTKLGIYGVVRVFCEFLPVSHYSYIWGEVIAIFGAISIFVGTMSALTQDDSKRLMSFHVIGQIGYMFLGIGLGVFLLPVNPPLATIALISGIFHLLNHTMYKSCLFLNAGSILYKTGARDLNKVGGLMRLMPFTAVTAIIASLSIAGIPPFSGFASKLLIFESSIMSGVSSPLFIILGLVAIFISAVTLASFLKFLNSAFLGKLYTESGVDIRGDVPLSMKIPQGILAFLCIFFGVAPLLPVRVIYNAVSSILPAGYSPSAGSLLGTSLPGFSLNFGQGSSGTWNPLWILIAILLLFALGYFISRAARSPVREAETWYGGRKHDVEHVRYTSHSFYIPFKRIFAFTIGGIKFEGLYPKAISLPKVAMPKTLRAAFDVDRWLYYPFTSGLMKLSRWFSRVHVGIPQVYILWIIIGVIVAILVLFALPAGVGK
jgi:hydrogenase-4 component B